MNRLRKEQLKENLEKLDAEEHSQIFAVIQRYTQEYTRTASGIFVSSDNLSDDCLIEIEKMVQYYLDQRKSLANRT